jgi:ribosomal protein S27E
MKCEACSGKKVVFGFGGMKTACKECKNPTKVDKDTVKVDKRTKQSKEG